MRWIFWWKAWGGLSQNCDGNRLFWHLQATCSYCPVPHGTSCDARCIKISHKNGVAHRFSFAAMETQREKASFLPCSRIVLDFSIELHFYLLLWDAFLHLRMYTVQVYFACVLITEWLNGIRVLVTCVLFYILYNIYCDYIFLMLDCICCWYLLLYNWYIVYLL